MLSGAVEGCTKHAIEGLTKSMPVELAPPGIHVNAAAPTFILTGASLLVDGGWTAQ
jgi:NAD(P)-dependent dehydrogenase (short-subunit alcohol dehydrogenase family)